MDDANILSDTHRGLGEFAGMGACVKIYDSDMYAMGYSVRERYLRFWTRGARSHLQLRAIRDAVSDNEQARRDGKNMYLQEQPTLEHRSIPRNSPPIERST